MLWHRTLQSTSLTWATGVLERTAPPNIVLYYAVHVKCPLDIVMKTALQFTQYPALSYTG